MSASRTRSRQHLDSGVLTALTSTLFAVERQVKRWWYPLLGLLLLAVLYVLFKEFGLARGMRDMRAWIDAWGHLAPVAFVGVYAVAATLGFPNAVLAASAGVLFGALQGVALCMAASLLAATHSFLIARHMLRGWVVRRLGRHPRFQKIDQLSQQHGATMVLAVRMLNLLPFSAVNYGFGVTRVSLTKYLLASFAGMIPGTVVLVVGIDAIYQALLYDQVPWGPLAVVVAASIGVALTLRYVGQRLPLDEARQQRKNR